MKQTTLLLLSIALLLTQQACQTRQQANSQVTDSTATTASETTTEVIITERLADLGLTPDSDWRGINLGDEFTKVAATEKGEPLEKDADHIGYSIDLKNLETEDILYYQTGKKVSAIDVDLFLNNRQSVTDFQKELEPYFTARYGTPKPAKEGNLWNGPKGTVVIMNDVSKGKDFGLKIKITQTGGSTTASAK